jgi:16S rRNA (guanine527-N7)-methyltransferase
MSGPDATAEAVKQAGLLERFGLERQQLAQLASLLGALAAGPGAPTAVRGPCEAARVHLADSLVAVELEAVRGAGVLADLGSGAGFPGLPLAVALPAGEVTLLESNRRRGGFIERMRAAGAVENARVVCARAEQWDEGIGANDVVLARALAAQPVVLEYAAPLLRAGGTLVDWRGRRNAAHERAAERAARELGLERTDVRRVVPFEGARDHHLHVFVKRHATPERFPRRPGVARKRPLGG